MVRNLRGKRSFVKWFGNVQEMVKKWPEMVKEWPGNGNKVSGGQETPRKQWETVKKWSGHFDTFVVVLEELRHENVVAEEMVQPSALGRVVRAPPS